MNSPYDAFFSSSDGILKGKNEEVLKDLGKSLSVGDSSVDLE
jgi:hypothetical protein